MNDGYLHTRHDRVALPTATVVLTPDLIRTILSDGSSADAVPADRDEDIARARSLGYGRAWDMHRDHDLTHSLLACWLGLRESPVLSGIARGKPLTKEGAGAEEQAVLAIQRFAQEQGVDLHEIAKALSGNY